MATKVKSEIQEAPVFHPTEEEFTDPLAYIEGIRHIAEKYGICKILPPKSWKPPFCIDMDSFKFTPRLQKLNELEAGSRMKMNFIEKLVKFWELQGQKLRIPSIERTRLDLFKLNSLVENKGGFDYLNQSSFWTEIAKEMNLKESSSKYLKSSYEKIIYPYNLLKSGATLTKSTSTTSLKRTNSHDLDDARKKKKPRKYKDINCLICSNGNDDAFMLLCDECDDSYHTYCLYPPLNGIPEGDWRCPNCVAEVCNKPSDSYGFQRSKKKYSLNEFGLMANKFKENYFKKQKETITSEEIEKEFWRLLSSPNESVIVEYGADLHTLETGSGFPTYSNKGKLNQNDKEYLNSPWNLNNLPKLDKSILSQMNVEISGMKVPWAYVGMLFSCFCWHVEDHWSYSVNYLHWGETKTWYGVSGNDADKFESIMKNNANDLFESSPDLLHHLVTIMDPSFLNENGVKISKINQNKGEFVVTFPRAYHAGFNQGFNFAEAVNFCPADWIPIGRAAVENYKLFKRHTVFSHDELVFKTACSKSVVDSNIISAIQSELIYLIDIEKTNQAHLKDKNFKYIQMTFELLTDDERTCDYCHTTCFLSAIKCSCSPNKLACPSHYEHVCTESNNKILKNLKQKIIHKRTFCYRYSIEEMQKTLSDLTIYLESYKKWCKSVDSLIKKEKKQYLFKTDSFENDDEIEIIENDQNNYNLNDSSTKPTISDLIKLIDYARFKKFDKFTYGEKLTNLLLKNLEETEICAENCRILLDLYKTNQTAKLSPLSDNFEDDVIVVEPARKVTLDDFKKVVNQLEEIACELPEKPTLLCIYHEIIKEENKIDQFIKEWNTNIPHVLRRYTNYLDNLSIEFDPVKIKKLKLLQNQSDWLHKVNSIEASELTIDKINYLIDKVTLNDLLASSEQSSQSIRQSYNQLIELLSIAQTWENKIEKLLAFDEPLSLETLEAAYKQAIEIPAKLFHVDRLSQVIKQVSNLKSNIKATLELRKPNLNYLTELLNETKKYPVIFDENLKIKVLYSNEWLIKLNNLFNFSQVCIQTAHLEHTEALNLIQILTPRIDLKTVIDTIHPNNNLNLSMPSILASKSKNKSKSGTVNKDSSDNSDNSLVVDLYAASTSGDSLREKIKFLELKEINFIKELRTLNTEKLKQIESVAMSANENRIEALKKNNFKCCACFKSIVSSIMSNSVDFCKLCLGIYHRNNSCKNASDSINSISSLCANCHRSRRPHTDQTYELLSEYEKLDISCSEERALEMFCHRFIKWQDRFNRVFDRDNLINLKLTINKQSINELRKIYAEMNPLKKVEINDLFIEGLLMEVSNENIQFLNEFCDLIEMNSDFQQILEGFGKIKPKKLSNQTDQGASSEQSSKACSKKSKSIHEIKSLNKLLKKNQKDAKKISRAKIGLTSGESDNREARSSIEIIEKKTDEQDDSKEDLETNESTDRDEEKSVTSKSSRSSNSSLFCICKRRSFGQMIGCDNEKCEIEWFHFECVRLKSKPKGKWYCPNCRPKF